MDPDYIHNRAGKYLPGSAGVEKGQERNVRRWREGKIGRGGSGPRGRRD